MTANDDHGQHQLILLVRALQATTVFTLTGISYLLGWTRFIQLLFLRFKRAWGSVQELSGKHA